MHIAESRFENIASKYNGSVAMIMESSVELDSCHFVSNQALNGIIYALTDVEIINRGCTYENNTALMQGGVYHLGTGANMKNYDRYVHIRWDVNFSLAQSY